MKRGHTGSPGGSPCVSQAFRAKQKRTTSGSPARRRHMSSVTSTMLGVADAPVHHSAQFDLGGGGGGIVNKRSIVRERSEKPTDKERRVPPEPDMDDLPCASPPTTLAGVEVPIALRKTLDGKWAKEMDDALREGVLRFGADNWPRVVANVHKSHDVAAVECSQRWAMIRELPVKGPWSAEEDGVLRALVAQYGSKKWSQIANGIPGRSGKQCRERWLNHLDARVKKSVWTPEEDKLLCAAQRTLGNKWSEISRMLPGRAENAVKNRFNSLITKRQTLATQQHQHKQQMMMQQQEGSGDAAGGRDLTFVAQQQAPTKTVAKAAARAAVKAAARAAAKAAAVEKADEHEQMGSMGAPATGGRMAWPGHKSTVTAAPLATVGTGGYLPLQDDQCDEPLADQEDLGILNDEDTSQEELGLDMGSGSNGHITHLDTYGGHVPGMRAGSAQGPGHAKQYMPRPPSTSSQRPLSIRGVDSGSRLDASFAANSSPSYFERFDADTMPASAHGGDYGGGEASPPPMRVRGRSKGPAPAAIRGHRGSAGARAGSGSGSGSRQGRPPHHQQHHHVLRQQPSPTPFRHHDDVPVEKHWELDGIADNAFGAGHELDLLGMADTHDFWDEGAAAASSGGGAVTFSSGLDRALARGVLGNGKPAVDRSIADRRAERAPMDVQVPMRTAGSAAASASVATASRAVHQEERRRNALFRQVQLSDSDLRRLQHNIKAMSVEAAIDVALSERARPPHAMVEARAKMDRRMDGRDDRHSHIGSTAPALGLPSLRLSLALGGSSQEPIIPPPLDIGSPEEAFEREWHSTHAFSNGSARMHQHQQVHQRSGSRSWRGGPTRSTSTHTAGSYPDMTLPFGDWGPTSNNMAQLGMAQLGPTSNNVAQMRLARSAAPGAMAMNGMRSGTGQGELGDGQQRIGRCSGGRQFSVPGTAALEAALRMSLASLSLDDDDWQHWTDHDGERPVQHRHHHQSSFSTGHGSRNMTDRPMRSFANNMETSMPGTHDSVAWGHMGLAGAGSGTPGGSSNCDGGLPWRQSSGELHDDVDRASPCGEPALGLPMSRSLAAMSPIARTLHELDLIVDPEERRKSKARLVEGFISVR